MDRSPSCEARRAQARRGLHLNRELNRSSKKGEKKKIREAKKCRKRSTPTTSFLSLSLSLSLSLGTSDILLLSFSSVIITSATLPFVLFVSAVVLWVSRRFSSPRISGRRKVSLSSLQPVWTEAAEAFRL